MSSGASTWKTEIANLRELVGEKYGRGFPVLREIVQNASDAGAERVTILRCGAGGLGSGRAPFRVPGLLFVNDGRSKKDDRDRLNQIGDSGKAGDGGVVGRHGLGQKSLFHYCDAYFYAGFDGSVAFCDSFNPYSDGRAPERFGRARGWEAPDLDDPGEGFEGSRADAATLRDAAHRLGFGDRAFAVWMPYRQSAFRVDDEGRGLSDWTFETEGDPFHAFGNEADIAALMAFTRLTSLHLRDGFDGTERVYATKGASARFDPFNPPAKKDEPRGFSFEVTRDGEAIAAVSGLECLKKGDDDLSAAGRAIPFDEVTGEREKADPHGAVVLVRCRTEARPAEMRLASYLPMDGDNSAVPLVGAPTGLTIYLHAAFFTDRGRQHLHASKAEGEGSVRATWNARLLDRIVLPLLGPALLAARGGEAVLKVEFGGVVRAVERGRMRAGLEERTGPFATPEQVLAHVLTPGQGRWAMIDRVTARPLPEQAFDTPNMLFTMVPPLKERVGSGILSLVDSGVTLGFGDLPSWGRNEIETLLDDMRGEALSKTPSAQMVRELLDLTGYEDLNGIAPLLRRMMDTGVVAQAPDTLQAILNRARPWPVLWANTSNIPKPLLAGEGTAPVVLDEAWKPVWAISHPFTLDQLATLLPKLGTLTERESTDAQRLAMQAIGQVGGSLDSFVKAHPSLADVSLLRALRAIDGKPVVLTVAETMRRSANGTLLREPVGGGGGVARLMARALDLPGAAVLRANFSFEGTGLQVEEIKRPAILDRCRNASTFSDDVSARLDLLEWLRPSVRDDSRALRSLCAGDDVGDDAKLVHLPASHAGGEDAQRAIDVLARVATARLVPTEIADGFLGGDMRRHLRIDIIDADTVADWIKRYSETLSDGEREGLVLFLGEESAALPLHKGTDGALHSLDGLWRVGRDPVPPDLSSLAHMLDMDDTPAADAPRRAWMERNGRVWSARAAIDTVLASLTPGSFAETILTAAAQVTDVEARAAVRDELAARRWLPTKAGTVVRPCDVLNLPGPVAAAARRVFDGREDVILGEDIDPALRDHADWAAVRDALGLPDEDASLESLRDRLMEASVRGGLGNADRADLVALARAGFDDASPVWALMAALLRHRGDGSDLAAFRPLTEDGEVNTRLAALGRFAQEKSGDSSLRDAARAAYDAAFRAAVSGAADDAARHARLRGTPVMTAAGHWRDAGEVVESGMVARPYRLADELAKLVHDALSGTRMVEDVDRSDDLPPIGLQDRKYLFDVLAPLHRLAPDETRSCYALFGTGEGERAAWKERFGDEDLRKIDDQMDKVAAILKEKDFDLDLRAVPLGKDGTTRATALNGRLLEAVPVDDGDGIFVNAYAPEGRLAERRVVLRLLKPKGAGEATRMLRDLAERLVRDVHVWVNVWRLPDGSGQVTLPTLFGEESGGRGAVERMIADIRDQLPGTLRAFKRNHIPSLDDALECYRHAARGEEAKRALWKAATTEEAQAELRAAVRHKIGGTGYTPDRTLLELFQNAHDAYAEAVRQGPVEVTFEAGTLRFLHWGRLVGVPAVDADEALARRQRLDLENMLHTGWSEKGADHVGTFGLGFKCVHLLSEAPGIVSGAESCRIRGGFMPEGWAEGFDLIMERDRGGYRATLIDLPVTGSRIKDAKEALKTLAKAAEGLLLLSGRVDALRVQDREWRVRNVSEVADGVRKVMLDTPEGSRCFLVFELDAARLVLRLKRGVPYTAWTPVPTLWRLAPLGSALGAHWMLDPAAQVDAGRTGLQGDDAAQKDVIAAFAAPLRDRLTGLFDTDGAEKGLGALRPDGEDPDDFAWAFWAGMQDVFASDYSGGGLRGALHRNAGWGRATRDRAIVPNLLDGTLVATNGDTLWIDETLKDRAEVLAALPSLMKRQLIVTTVNKDAASAMGLGEGPANAFDLCMGEIKLLSRVSDGVAAAMGGMVDLIDDEGRAELAEKARFDAVEGGARAVSDLFVDPPAFAPDTARLSDTYGPDAIAFFEALKSNPPLSALLLRWVEAARDDVARNAVLDLALKNEDFANALRDRLPTWLREQNVERLARGFGFSAAEAALLAERLSVQPANTPTRPFLDPAACLDLIYDWWARTRDTPTGIEAYEEAVYPASRPDLARIAGGTRDPEWIEDEGAVRENQTAWFTLLALACFRTLPWNREATNRNFLTHSDVAAHWDRIATSDPTEDAVPWRDMLHDWYDVRDERIDFHTWRRTFGDLYTLRRYLTEYQRLFASLPDQAARGVDLASALTPSRVSAEHDVTAPPLHSLIRHGGPWLIRELCRNAGEGRFYSRDEAAILSPWCWSPRSRIRRFLGDSVGMTIVDSDTSADIHHKITAAFGDQEKARFMGDYDLPIDILSRDAAKAAGVLGENDIHPFLALIDA